VLFAHVVEERVVVEEVLKAEVAEGVVEDAVALLVGLPVHKVHVQLRLRVDRLLAQQQGPVVEAQLAEVQPVIIAHVLLEHLNRREPFVAVRHGAIGVLQPEAGKLRIALGVVNAELEYLGVQR
jgi:hypothetical protein